MKTQLNYQSAPPAKPVNIPLTVVGCVLVIGGMLHILAALSPVYPDQWVLLFHSDADGFYLTVAAILCICAGAWMTVRGIASR